MNKSQAYKKLESFGFIRLTNIKDVRGGANVIWLTGCSKLKSDRADGNQKQIYVSNKNKTFYNFCENRNYNYGTISDKYGLINQNDIIKNYDLPPEALSKEEKEYLKQKIENQINKDITIIYFYSPRLLQALTYLSLFENIKVTKYLVTSLKEKNKRKLI